MLYYDCPPSQRILYYWSPPKGFFTIHVRQKDLFIIEVRQMILYYWSPPKGFFTMHVRQKHLFIKKGWQKDSLVCMSAKRICLLLSSAKGFFTHVRQKDSLLFMFANTVCLLLRSAKGFFTIHVRQKDSLLFMSANKSLKNFFYTVLKNSSVLLVNSLVSEHFFGSIRGGPLRVAGSD